MSEVIVDGSPIGRVLVVVPCGRSKAWDAQPDCGPKVATEAYTGNFFKMNQTYAECFGDAWVILSSKYGFIRPEFVIPGSYEVTFKRRITGPVAVDVLERQVMELGLSRFKVVVGLGGIEYRSAVEAAFAGQPVSLMFPFAGLPIGKLLQTTQRAVASGDPGFIVGSHQQ
jgi:hypothetical protein